MPKSKDEYSVFNQNEYFITYTVLFNNPFCEYEKQKKKTFAIMQKFECKTLIFTKVFTASA